MSVNISLEDRRKALFVLFFLPGITLSSWVTRTPDVRDLLGASTFQMGLILFGLSAGSMAGILASGPLVARWGVKRVVLIGNSSVLAGAVVLGLGAGAGSAVLAATGLGLFGLGVGGSEVAANIEGALVEQGLGRSTMPAVHGFFSLGTVVGALAGMLLTAISFPVPAHLLIIAVIDALLLAYAIRLVPAETGREDRTPGKPRSRARVWRDGRMVLIGFVVLALAMAEGTANDWLPLLMVDGHDLAPVWGSLSYVIFSAAMTVGRFAGGAFVDRLGRRTVLAASSLIAAAGLATVSFADSALLAGAAAILWGLGSALGFPVALSAAADSGPDSAARVALVATIGYVAFLVGPPALGFIGEHWGLRNALIPVIVLSVAAVFAARAGIPARRRARV